MKVKGYIIKNEVYIHAGAVIKWLETDGGGEISQNARVEAVKDWVVQIATGDGEPIKS